MPFQRGQVQTLYNYLPGAVFAHDDYGYCLSASVSLDSTVQTNVASVLDAVVEALQTWRDAWRRPGFPEPRDGQLAPKDFTIGTPAEVSFEPYPSYLQCLKCQRVYRIEDLDGRNLTPGRCPGHVCGGTLAQFMFVQAHNCGRLEPVYLDRKGCTKHGTSDLYFDDTGRVRTARWRCRRCGGREVARLRQTPCSCDYSRHASADDPRRMMRFFAITDPAIFRSRVVPFVNFPQEEIVPLLSPQARGLILARVWGLASNAVKNMLEDQEQAERRSGPEYQRMLREIERLDPGNALVVEWRRSQENPTPGIGEAARVRTLLGCPEGTEPEVSRKLVEQAAILDNLRTTTTQGAVVQFRKQGDVAAADSILAAADYAMKSLGIADVRAVEDFPIGLVAAGYTRVSANPDDSMLVPYPAVSGRTPLHVVASLTEAIYCQLDPLRVIGWLNDNGLASFEAPSESADGWSLLYRSLPGLRYSPNHPSHDEPAAAAVRTLLHTMSHVLLRHIEWSGYAPQSIGEYMLPGGLAFVLYASRYTATKVGGLLTLFEQHLGLWLQECFQEGRDCMYDPFCREDGGSCVGCLHREYNCPSFNGELSRATLYGGPCPREGRAALPFRHIARGYWEER